MGEKQVIVTLEDGFGRVQTSIATSLSAPQLMDKIMEIDEQQATIQELERKLKKYAKIGEEQLKQIIELQEENRELRQSVEYWQKKYEEGTETFQID